MIGCVEKFSFLLFKARIGGEAEHIFKFTGGLTSDLKWGGGDTLLLVSLSIVVVVLFLCNPIQMVRNYHRTPQFCFGMYCCL